MKGNEEEAKQYLREPTSFDWEASNWKDHHNTWATAGPAVFGRERISGVDLTKMHQISIYTFTQAGTKRAAPAGFVEESDPVEDSIMETRGFSLLLKGMHKYAAKEQAQTAAVTPDDLLKAAQQNTGVVGRALTWSKKDPGKQQMCGGRLGTHQPPLLLQEAGTMAKNLPRPKAQQQERPSERPRQEKS